MIRFQPVACSLEELLGADYVEAVVRARAFLTGQDPGVWRRLARERVELYPEALQRRLQALLPDVGRAVVPSCDSTARGATTRAFAAATKTTAAPLSGFGYFRIGEDGRLYLISKSEHYHALLGHGFPGFALVEKAKALGIPNATHNNTRGHIVRRLEEELLRVANGLAPDADLAPVVKAEDPLTLNRVLNLETGSLAAEAALKLALARFYQIESGTPAPDYPGRIPVILVVGDDDGGLTGNYHGTTLVTQVLRGLWPDLRAKLETGGLYRVCAIRPNRSDDLEAAFRTYEAGPYKIAAFFHEIVLMNYGARLLSEPFLRQAYELCRRCDVPVVVDEIQSCMWYEGAFLYRQYGLQPAMVVVGKGFSGGEYPASRIIFNARYDRLTQFGALVTNGQEELASLAYLVAMKWAAVNGAAIAAAGREIEESFRQVAAEFPAIVGGVEGKGHLLGLRFRDLGQGRRFTERMNRFGFDISVQAYKANCPPVALTKLPLIADSEAIALLIARLREALRQVT